MRKKVLLPVILLLICCTLLLVISGTVWFFMTSDETDDSTESSANTKPSTNATNNSSANATTNSSANATTNDSASDYNYNSDDTYDENDERVINNYHIDTSDMVKDDIVTVENGPRCKDPVFPGEYVQLECYNTLNAHSNNKFEIKLRPPTPGTQEYLFSKSQNDGVRWFNRKKRDGEFAKLDSPKSWWLKSEGGGGVHRVCQSNKNDNECWKEDNMVISTSDSNTKSNNSRFKFVGTASGGYVIECLSRPGSVVTGIDDGGNNIKCERPGHHEHKSDNMGYAPTGTDPGNPMALQKQGNENRYLKWDLIPK